MILITKRREDGFRVCKASIMCSKLVMLESVPNTPLGFQIQAHENKFLRKSNNEKQADNAPPDSYVLLASTQEEKKHWTFQIKQLIIATLTKEVPCDARNRLLRDGDGDGNPDDSKRRLKSRYGSNTRLGGPDSKPTKSPLARLTSNPTPSSASLTSVNQLKNRRRSDSMSRKTLHKKALQKRKDEVDSSEDISADSSPNTPSGVKIGGKFSFPSFRQSTRTGSAQHTNKQTTTQAKSNQGKANGVIKKSVSMKPSELKKSNSNDTGDVVKRHHNSVIYRRHKRRTSQPITYTEKRLSMKITEDEGENNNKNDDEQLDEEELLNFNHLKARESVSWDIQIVEAVFERYKNEDPSSVTSPTEPDKTDKPDLESAYLTAASDIAPNSVIALNHPPGANERRKSRIVVVPSDLSGDEKKTKKPSKPVPAVIRRRRSKNSQTNNKRASGVVYTLSQELDVESDSGLNETKSILRKVVQASENARNSMVIHESDTEVETNQILIEKASTVRRKSSLKRRERNARRRLHSGSNANDNNNNIPQNVKLRDDTAMKTTVTSSIQSMSTPTISMVDSKSGTTTVMTTVQSATPTTIVSPSVTINHNSNHNNNAGLKNRPVAKKDARNIPTGKVRGLIERLRGNSNADVIVVSSNGRRTPLTSPKFSVTPKETFTFKTSDVINTRDSVSTSHIASKDSNPTKQVVTTESVPITFTSSSESDDEATATAGSQAKQPTAKGTNPALHGKKKSFQNPPPVYLRRTFSQDNNASNMRRTTNAQFESRACAETTPMEAVSALQHDEYKFEGVESFGEGKHYLFQKLYLGPPGESRVTDIMSEEFEHVCSDLENNRLNSVDSHNFSNSEDEKSATSRLGRFLRKDLVGKLSRKEAAKDRTTDSNVRSRQKSDTSATMLNYGLPGKLTAETFQQSENSNIETGRRSRSTLPSRNNSLRSTKSEYLSSTRGRSSASRHRYPSKDMHAIPQMNVAKLAKQFNDNCSPTELRQQQQVAVTPRRSKSVGGAARTRRRLQEKQELQRKQESSPDKSASVSDQMTTSQPDLTSRHGGVDEPKGSKRDGLKKSRFEKAEVKTEDVEFFRSTNYSVKLHTAVSTEEESVTSPKSVGDDDVFDSSAKTANKKRSLIEMFAANPKSGQPAKRDFQPLQFEQSTQTNPRVLLVRTPDREDGRSGFEPKVLNSPSPNQEKDCETAKLSEKRKSWSNLAPANDESKRRTRYRSSSLTRTRMRAALSPKS